MYEDQNKMMLMINKREAEERKARVLNQVNQMVISGDITFAQLQELSAIAYEKEQKDDARSSDG